MPVTILIPSALRSETGGEARLKLTVEGPVSLRDVLDAVAVSHPRLERRLRDESGLLRRFVNFYVGDEECRALDGQDTQVAEGQDVQILPSVAGG
ncbi:MoaD/ThiS family protein [Haloglycomyces albus]|uniref:MoaD/ThiS family protein n=1 Tax=Haloglycomyces albus TaxID=526067 RepID=UPI00046D8631|nr:MoaD/ThiS family protein [Haloglycomyces albus]